MGYLIQSYSIILYLSIHAFNRIDLLEAASSHGTLKGGINPIEYIRRAISNYEIITNPDLRVEQNNSKKSVDWFINGENIFESNEHQKYVSDTNNDTEFGLTFAQILNDLKSSFYNYEILSNFDLSVLQPITNLNAICGLTGLRDKAVQIHMKCYDLSDYEYAMDKNFLKELRIVQRKDHVEIVEVYPNLEISNVLGKIEYMITLKFQPLKKKRNSNIKLHSKKPLRHLLKVKFVKDNQKRRRNHEVEVEDFAQLLSSKYDNYTVQDGYVTIFPVNTLCTYAYRPGYYNVAKFYNVNDTRHKDSMDIKNILLKPYLNGIAMEYEGFMTQYTNGLEDNKRTIINMFSDSDLYNIQRIVWVPNDYIIQTTNAQTMLTFKNNTINQLYMIDLGRPNVIRSIKMNCLQKLAVYQNATRLSLTYFSNDNNKARVSLIMGNHLLVKMDLDKETQIQQNKIGDEPDVILIKILTICHGPESGSFSNI